MSIRVFISHSHDDRALSRALCALLEETLDLTDKDILNTSDADTDIAPGASILEELRRAMVSTEALVFLVTPSSGSRTWVQREMGAALFANKPFFVLLHPDAKLPDEFSSQKATLIDRELDVAGVIDALNETLKLSTKANAVKTVRAVSAFVEEVKAYNPERTLLHFGNRLELEIRPDDLFRVKGAIALPCDNRYDRDKDAETGALYGQTLIGQFRARYLRGKKLDAFRAEMIQRLDGREPTPVFRVGHVTSTPLDGPPEDVTERLLFLVVLFNVENYGTSVEGAASAPDVWTAYANLWDAVARVRPPSLAVPLLGCGQSGAGLSRQQSCALAVLSAVSVALSRPIYSRLTIVCRDRETYRNLDLRSIATAAGLAHGPRR